MNADDILETIMAAGGSVTAEQIKQLQTIINQLDTTVYEEDAPKQLTAAQLRKKYPALKDAYNQYRLVLKLVQGQEIV